MPEEKERDLNKEFDEFKRKIEEEIFSFRSGLRRKEEEEKMEKIKTKEMMSNLVDNIGFIPVVDSIPSEAPTHPLKKIVIYNSGTTIRLYIYDSINNAWHYTTLT